MDKLIILFYVILAMSVLLNAVFIWGTLTYTKVKTKIKFLNTPLLTLTLSVAAIGFILALVPIILHVWTYTGDFIKSDPVFLSILVLEIVFLVAFLVLAYVFAFDFGIALDEDETRLQFFGQTVNTEKIVAMQQKKYSLKIVYEQGFKNIKKKVTIFTPNAKHFIQQQLSGVINDNIAKRKMKAIVEANTAAQEIVDSEKDS